MKWIGRYILNTLTVLSLVLCVATVGLWVRSYSRIDLIGSHSYPGGDRRCHFWMIGVGDGWVSLACEDFVPHDTSDYPPGLFFGSESAGAAPRRRGFLGLSFNRFTTPSGHRTDVDVALWFLVLLLGSPLVHRAMRRIRAAKFRDLSRCAVCHYDLRATPDRCPECGTIPAPNSSD